MTLKEDGSQVTITDGSARPWIVHGLLLLVGSLIAFLLWESQMRGMPLITLYIVLIINIVYFHPRTAVIINTESGTMIYKAGIAVWPRMAECPTSAIRRVYLDRIMGGRAPSTYAIKLSTANGVHSIRVGGELFKKQALLVFEGMKPLFPHAKFEVAKGL